MATCYCTRMSRIIGVQDACAAEEHVSINDDYCFPKLGALSMEAPQERLVFALFSEALETGLRAPDAKSDWCPGRNFGIGCAVNWKNSCLAMQHGVAIEALLVSRTSMTTRLFHAQRQAERAVWNMGCTE